MVVAVFYMSGTTINICDNTILSHGISYYVLGYKNNLLGTSTAIGTVIANINKIIACATIGDCIDPLRNR